MGINRHGRNGYKRGCRCDVCRKGHAAYHWEWRMVRLNTPLAPDDPRHGTVNGYSNYGCRCEACTAANTAAWSGRRGKSEPR